MSWKDSAKLRVLKWVFILMLWVLWATTKRERFKWLLHYLLGSGQDMGFPKSQLPLQTLADGRWRGKFSISLDQGYRYNLFHSLHYNGYGFWGRPETFYMVGGMSFLIEFKGRSVHITGTDVYDWHPTSDGNYFGSPIPKKLLFLHRAARKFWGDDYFPMEGYPMGGASVSNKLWHDLELVGAKPFTTIVDVTIDKYEWRKHARKAHTKRREGRVW